MSPDQPHSGIRIRTLAELADEVVLREPHAEPETPAIPSKDAKGGTVAEDESLSPQAEAFLRHAVEPHHRELGLEKRWEAIGVRSGSAKSRILKELRRHGLIRLERKGRVHALHLYNKAYTHLGLEPPRGEGVGGATHAALVKAAAARFRKRGYEVHIEQEIGPRRKRVDLVAYGRLVVGAEIGLSDMRQELKNLRDDLEAGVLDRLVFLTSDEQLLHAVRTKAAKDPAIARHWFRLGFYLIGESCHDDPR